jgi:tetratricopeptide (TPR) repeat protein
VARGLCSEARQWLEAGLARSSGVAHTRRAEALLALGGVAIEHGRLDGARRALEEALTTFRALGDEAGVGKVSSRLGVIAWRQGAYERAAACDALAVGASRPPSATGGSAPTPW